MSDFRRAPLQEMTRGRAATAKRDLPATLIIRDGTLVSVAPGEILPNMSVAVQGPQVVYAGCDASHTTGEEIRAVEAEDRYVALGFLDGHCHIEGTLLTVTQFARAVHPVAPPAGSSMPTRSPTCWA
jgi:adenine deaminase